MEGDKNEKKNLTDTLTEISVSVIKLAQERVIEKIENKIDHLITNIVFLIITAFLGVLGLVFVLLGVSMWIGILTGLGLWFGFVCVGVFFLMLAFLFALIRKLNK